jgi:predicted nucleotidyltransferase
MVDKTIINTAKLCIQQIPAELEVKRAYLFGSYANGNQHPDSDIDIAIVIGKMDDFFAVQMQLMRLRRKIDLRIEPHPILEDDFNIQNPFAYEVERTGIELL